jgi:CheY-like chemotaxis protein
MTRPTILLVDDDADYLEIATRAVEKERLPAHLRVVRTGEDALRALGLAGSDATRPPPTLVAAFVDLNMPGVDGWEILRRVRSDARLRQLPVVIVSSSAHRDDVRRSYEMGANSYFVKGYDPTGPGRDLARAMRYWIESNRVAHWAPSVPS